MFGNEFTYRCDEPGCDNHERVGSMVSLEGIDLVLTSNNWLRVGKYCYCPLHAEKYRRSFQSYMPVMRTGINPGEAQLPLDLSGGVGPM